MTDSNTFKISMISSLIKWDNISLRFITDLAWIWLIFTHWNFPWKLYIWWTIKVFLFLFSCIFLITWRSWRYTNRTFVIFIYISSISFILISILMNIANRRINALIFKTWFCILNLRIQIVRQILSLGAFLLQKKTLLFVVCT